MKKKSFLIMIIFALFISTFAFSDEIRVNETILNQSKSLDASEAKKEDYKEFLFGVVSGMNLSFLTAPGSSPTCFQFNCYF